MTDRGLFASVRGVKTTDVIAAQIQEMIVEKRLSPGDALPSERELASLMSVSRNALREAIGRLVEKGLVVTQPGKGTFVAEPSFANMKESLGLLLQLNHVDLVELCDVRLLIEPLQAGLAAQNAATSDLTEITASIENLRATALDAAGHVLADLRFHAAIAALANHAVYEAIVDVVREPVLRGMVFGTKVPRAIDFSDDHHEQIFEAIIDGKAVDAANAMREHLTYVREYLLLHRSETEVWRSSWDES
jgi:GntR family transcriptional repressor for pyruvate dehydrogenase complex